MKNFALVILLVAFLGACQASGHKEQSWKPKTGKKMKAGRNR